MSDITEQIKHRSEILFVYDVSEANPNGDPLELNSPRVDPDTGHNLVTDVRLKRTVRDYLIEERGYDGSNELRDVFVREILMASGGIQDGKTRGKQFGSKSAELKANVTARCIDVRLFGATIPMEEDSVTLTGPVQFRLARSVNRVEVFHIKGTGAFASKAGAGQATFREEDFVHYSLIPFYGAINPIAAKDTGMTTEDEALLLEALWFGTKHLHSRSKLGHVPRLLLKVNYAEQSSFVGELQRHLKLNLRQGLVSDKDMRSVEDYTVAIDSLVAHLQEAKNGEGPFGAPVRIASIQVVHDSAFQLTIEDGEDEKGEPKRKKITDLCEELRSRLGVEVSALTLKSTGGEA
jgi:CRISPR-associated protein Csh2